MYFPTKQSEHCCGLQFTQLNSSCNNVQKGKRAKGNVKREGQWRKVDVFQQYMKTDGKLMSRNKGLLAWQNLEMTIKITILPNVMGQHINFNSKKFTKKRFFIIFKYPQWVVVQGKLYFKKNQKGEPRQTYLEIKHLFLSHLNEKYEIKWIIYLDVLCRYVRGCKKQLVDTCSIWSC